MDRILYLVDKETDKVFHELSVRSGLVQGSVVFKNNLESVLEFTVDFDDSYLIGRNTSVLVKDSQGRFVEFDIDESENIDGEDMVYYCIPRALNDLGLGKPFVEGTSFNNMTSREFFSRVLSETRYSIGEVDYVGSLTVELEESQYPMEVIDDYIQEHELKGAFHVYLNNGEIVNRVVDFKKKERIETGKEFRRGKDMLTYKTREVVSDLITAVRGVSKVSSEGSDDELLLSEEVYNDEVVKEIGGVHRWGLLESDAETVDELRAELIQKLDEVSSIHESFEVGVEDLSHFLAHEKVYVGDYVYIKDNKSNPPLILGGEITEETINLVDERDRSYIVGDIGRVRKEYDGMRDQLKKMGKRFNGLLRELSDLRREFASIEGPEDEDVGGLSPDEMVHINILENGNINPDVRNNVSRDVDLHDYEVDLTVKGRGTGDGKLMILEKMLLDVPNPYTLHFKVKFDRDCRFKFVVLSGVYASVFSYFRNGELVDREEYDRNNGSDFIDFKAHEEVEFNISFLYNKLTRGDRPGDKVVSTNFYGNNAFDFELERLDGVDVNFEFSELVMYKGTYKYGVKDIMRRDYGFGQADMGFENNYLKERSFRTGSEGSGWGATGYEFLRIRTPNRLFDGNLMRLKFELVINKFKARDNDRPKLNILTGGNRFYSGSAPNHQNRVRMEGDEVILRSYYDKSGSLSGLFNINDWEEGVDSFPLKVDVEVFMPSEVSDTIGVTIDFGNTFSVNIEEMDFEINDVRLYNGMAPQGVDVEEEMRDDIREIKSQLDSLFEMMRLKADRDHTHSIYDVDGLRDELTDLDNNKADVGHTHVIEDVEGLSVELSGKRDVNGIIQISEVDGLSDILDDYSQRLIDGGL